MLARYRRYRLEFKYLAITGILLLSVVVLNRFEVFSGVNQGINDFIDGMNKLGFIGIFIVALLGNIALIIQVPYTSTLVPPALAGASFPHMMFLGVVAGIGSGIGETLKYGLADKILQQKPDLRSSKLVKWVEKFTARHPRLIPPVVVVWTALPIFPDDGIIIPLAMVKYGMRKIFVPLMLGKLAHNLMIALAVFFFTDRTASAMQSTDRSSLALSVLILIIMFILYQIEKARSVMNNQRASIPAE